MVLVAPFEHHAGCVVWNRLFYNYCIPSRQFTAIDWCAREAQKAPSR